MIHQSIPQALVEAQPQTPPAVDTDLAVLLSRLAALQGVALPVHRFEMMSTSEMGSTVDQLSRPQRAIEWWLSALPNGVAQQMEGLPDRSDIPLLWISAEDGQVGLLTSVLVGGGCGVEWSDGQTGELSVAQLQDGKLLAMRTTVEADAADHEKPKTASNWFFYAIRKRYRVFVESVIATALASLLTLAISFYTMQVYDRVVPNQGYSTLAVLTVGVVLALMFELLMKQLRARMMDRVCKEIDEELSGVFFSRVLSIRMDARPRSIGTFASQVKQFETVRQFMTSSTLFLIADLPFVIFFLAVMFSIGGMVVLVPLALLPLSIGVGLYARWHLMRATEEQAKSANRKNGVLIEAIDGIEAIKAVGGEWKLQHQWQRLTRDMAIHEMDIRNTSTMSANMTQTIQQLSYILMIAFGAYLITVGQITQGALMACSIISNRALGPISQISGMIVQWQQSRIALAGLDDMMKLPSDHGEGERHIIPGKCRGELSLEAASLSYHTAIPALLASTLMIKPGERIALLGAVGSGKSSLIKLLSGLYKPTEGRAFLDGVDMMHLAPEYVREHIGYLTQDVRLFSGSLRDNLVLGLPSPTDAQVLQAAAQTGLDQLVKSHPAGMGLPIFEGGRGLSGGQRQLVGLTRMLIARPSILLLDEPTASLDGDLEVKVMRTLFHNMAADAVIVLATHKRSLLGLVDRIIVMDKGRIVIDGPRDEVMAKLGRPAPASARPTLPTEA